MAIGLDSAARGPGDSVVQGRHSATVFWGLLERTLWGCILTSPTDDLWAHPLNLNSNVTSQTPHEPYPTVPGPWLCTMTVP